MEHEEKENLSISSEILGKLNIDTAKVLTEAAGNQIADKLTGLENRLSDISTTCLSDFIMSVISINREKIYDILPDGSEDSQAIIGNTDEEV